MRLKILLRYLAAGLFVGGFWYLNRAKPPYEEVLRTLAVFALWLLILKSRLSHRSIELHFFPAFAGKAAMIIIAALAETPLRAWTDNPALPVAIGLALAVAGLGLVGHPHFFTHRGSVS
ncbi:hypothetical protein [Sphingomonas sp. BAUL-RG-20F-R05-02]|uniref:hypothetical protein n=1 Tax=Sphingomonas sp. BAUL-RG-20F-R05-02 TaxID=2914830 RepID=UPI001F58272A|nr:hypothetical protein [Sphingomonas sp. BAUL-RG-20F-R05-02]